MISRFYFSLFLSLLPPGIVQAADTFPARPVRIVKTPQFAEQFAPEGIVPVGNTPDQFTQVMIADIAKWAKVIKSAGIRGEQ